MYTYQDLIEAGQDETERMKFVLSAISAYKHSDLYETAKTADAYNRKRNETIMKYEKTLTALTGQKVPDIWSPNHKTTRGFFSFFTTQQNQYLLSNGVTWTTGAGGKALGDDFDNKLKKAGKRALVCAVSYGYYNLDHVDVFDALEFAPLEDEENGSLRAGIRFWQINSSKPLRATLYEEDGYTDYIWNPRRDDQKDGAILHPKRPHKQTVAISEADGEQIVDGENYPSFPIVPFWGNEEHQSELVGIQEQIDAYDLIKNGFLNDLDSAQLYWILKNAGGMDDEDLVQFLERLHMQKIASVDDGADVQATTVEIPYAAREELLNRLEADLYKDYMALNIDDIKAGVATATQIRASYNLIDTKADMYEYQVTEFIKGLLEIAGVEDEPTYTRNRIVNVNEDITTVLQAETVLDEEYTTEKVLAILGDGDKYEEVQKRKDEEQASRIPAEVPTEEGELSE